MGQQSGAAKNYSDKQWENCLFSDRDRLVLFARNPKSLFTYWEWSAAKAKTFEAEPDKGELILRFFYADTKNPAFEIPCRWNQLYAYLEPPQPGKSYFAVLCQKNSGEETQNLLYSNTINIPLGHPAQVAGDFPPSSGERIRP